MVDAALGLDRLRWAGSHASVKTAACDDASQDPKALETHPRLIVTELLLLTPARLPSEGGAPPGMVGGAPGVYPQLAERTFQQDGNRISPSDAGQRLSSRFLPHRGDHLIQCDNTAALEPGSDSELATLNDNR